MTSLRFVHSSCLAVCLAVFAYQFIQDLPIDVRVLGPECIRDTIESNQFCDIVVSNNHRGVFLRNTTFDSAILRAKFETFFIRKNVLRFLAEQGEFLHVLDEAILNQRFVMCFGFMAMCIAIIEVFVVRRMGNLVRSLRTLKLYEEVEWKEWRRCVSYFLHDKIPVLMFCVVRTPEPPMNKHYIDFGEYVRDTLSLRSRSTDITLFACFYCLLAICHVSTNSIFFRFTKTVHIVERPVKTRLRLQSVFVVLFLTLTSVVALSGILLGGSFVSIAFLHPDYSMILIFESALMFIRCLYVLDRLTQCVSANRMAQIECRKSLSDEQVSTILSTGIQNGVSRNAFRNIYVHSTLFMALTLNGFYLKNGLFTNRKLLALGFASSAVQTMYTHANSDKILPTDLL